MTASDIIDKFGSAAELARQLGVPFTTVASWRQCNQIPAWRQPKILELASAQGIGIATTDFPPPDERVPFGRADAA